ncbi:MAG: hypothetical protein M1419_09435 [Bacteroidetes bacterium]|nr:hypothetical protein [Bacteroidota bacterium]
MFSKILNYGIRALIIIIGILMVTGVVYIPNSGNNSIIVVFGIIFILFGFVRIYMYYSSTKRYQREKRNGSE